MNKIQMEQQIKIAKEGIEVLELDASNLTVGRGGPRCMSMPLEREL